MKVLREAAGTASKRADHSLKVHLLHLDLCVSILSKLWVYTLSASRSRLIWRKRAKGFGRRNRLVENILANGVNFLLAIRTVAESGLHLPAKVLIRGYVEAADILLAVVGDEVFCEKYEGWPATMDPPALQYWKEHTAPRRVRIALELTLRRLGLPETDVSGFCQNRRELYEWLSHYSHGHPTAMTFGAYDHEPQARMMKSAVGGRAGAWTKFALRELAIYNTEMLVVLVGLLMKQHGWKRPESNRGLRELWDALTLQLSLVGHLRKRLQRSNPSTFLPAWEAPQTSRRPPRSRTSLQSDEGESRTPAPERMTP